MFNPIAQKGILEKSAALGVPAISAEHTMVIHGHEELTYHIANFAFPHNLPEEAILGYLAGGIEIATPQLPKTHFSSPITFLETANGTIEQLIALISQERNVITRRTFDFDIYRGTPDAHTIKWPCKNGFLYGFEPTEVDAEDRSSLTKLTGQVSYYFFGVEKGNL